MIFFLSKLKDTNKTVIQMCNHRELNANLIGLILLTRLEKNLVNTSLKSEYVSFCDLLKLTKKFGNGDFIVELRNDGHVRFTM